MSSSDQRKPRPARTRREPLFHLEAEDVAPRNRPPQPLRELVGDLDTALDLPATAAKPLRPERAVPLQPQAAQPAPARANRPNPAAPPTAVRERAPRTPPALWASDQIIAEAEAVRRALIRYDDSEADLVQAELLTARPYRAPVRAGAPPLAANPALILAIIATVSIFVLVAFRGGADAGISPWRMPGAGEPAPVLISGAARPAGDYTLKAPPSLTPQQIDRILSQWRSPAAGTGAIWYDMGLRYGIDPAFAVAFFIHESGAGTARNWAGLKPGGATTHNVGNIICAGYPTCYNRFRDYPSWEAGIEDWYRLIDVEYIQGRGHRTVADIIPIYAPAFENDVDGYINTIHRLVDQWRQGRIP